jgi:chemotaxis protein MotB
MAAGGGGAWKVAYADFVTAMMAFFMVMWLVGQKEEAKEAIAHYFEEPFDDQEAHAAAHGHAAHAPKPHDKKGAGKPKSISDDPHHPEARKSRILAIHGGDRAAFGTLVNFPGDSVQLDATGKELLDLAIPKFVGIPQKIEIRGHVSNQSAVQNDAWKLSYERSLAVMDYLVKHGIRPSRIRLAQAGAHEPLTISGEAGEMARNSRVDVFLLEEFAEETVGTPEERSFRNKADADVEKKPTTPPDDHSPRFIYRGGSDNPPAPSAKKDEHHSGKDAHHGDKHDKHDKHEKHGHGAPPAAKAKAAH